jgi:hypothetical protein
MKPLEAFQFLHKEQLPLILSFPLEEEKGHLITGKGICYVDKIHGSSRVTFSRFSPAKLMGSLRKCASFYATFTIVGMTYGCFIKDLAADGSKMTASVPDSLSPFMRRFLRVEPSLKSPVTVYLRPPDYGTVSFAVKDISECGLGFDSPAMLDMEGRIYCGIELPGAGFILAEAAVVYKKDEVKGGLARSGRRLLTCGILYGLELFFHSEDAKKVRMYIMQREIEVRNLLQQW